MAVNKKTKRSSHPIMFFIYLSVLIILISGITDLLNFQVTYGKLTTIAGEIENTTIAANSLLSLDGIKFLITSAYDNLINFEPFGYLLIASLGFAVAYKSGFFKKFFEIINKRIPKFIIVFLYSLFCILLSFDSHVGYVILLPLGAILFMSMNRNPLGGLALAFSSVVAGEGVGFFVAPIDHNISSYTEASAKLIDAEYSVLQSGNLIFSIFASILIAVIFTFITEKITSKKLGRNLLDDDNELMAQSADEKKGIIAAFIALIVLLIPVILMIIPSSKDGFIGLLLDKSQADYSKMLFSSDSLFMTNFVGMISLIIGIQGFVYGIVSGSIKKIRDMINFSTDYFKSIGSIFILIFFAAGLSAVVKETNLGAVLTGLLTNLIGSAEFSFIPLVLVVLLIVVIVNILMPASVSKWSIIAPNIMPAMISANVTPEFAQLIFKAGDTISNIITPVFPYFVIFIGFVEIYIKNKNDFGIKKCYSLVLSYFITLLITWVLLIICWCVIKLPIGPGLYVTF